MRWVLPLFCFFLVGVYQNPAQDTPKDKPKAPESAGKSSNGTNEWTDDWNDVELSLVAGAPHSFIQQLSQPYYGRRPVVALPESVQLTPQTHEATLESETSHEDTTPRALIIEHPARPEWKLAQDVPQPEEKAAGLYRFRLNVEPKKTERLVISEAKPQFTQYELKTLTDKQIELLLQQKSINPEVEKALRRITAQKNAVAEYDSQIKVQQKLMDQIFADQARLRENMKSLKGSTEEKALLQRYTKQLDDEETRLDFIKKKKQDLEAQQQLSDIVLRNMIQELGMDVTL